ncbi:P-loop containing nucleoside triphosphate hydrolase protein [Echria macrotheca]|uniref:P-loop containing nucleoside triphosphate hydrolase protein n=1 Tax=Echria macrotheca TaxID=438768 RepID=A0AAJ0BIS1_9PEZI|nr:P-loop containing nucleoside triphosphate hydrolase protein [Echria macrotheca]
MLKDDLLGLKNKLQALDAERIELASLAGDKGSGYQGTDTGFALGRFLSYAGSLCNSPPCSPSGSPVIAPSDAVINAESCDPCSPIANASALDKLSGIEYALQDLQDIGNLYPVPHIAVVGDKSAGKTSLVASLTGIKFRRVETACTRCATEIRLRRNKTNNTKLWIQPDRHCADSERGALQEFDHEVEQATSDEISSWLCRVADGIFPRAPDYVHGASRGISFVTRHKIIIEKSGPDLPCLTLVDLPGLVRYPNHEQSAEDLLIIEELTDFYIKDPHTVIVAVVAANMDYMEAPILEKVVSIDPQGTRTIGILTKPDIAESCGYADRYIRLMTGQDSNPRLKLEFSWYAVLNPGPGCDPTVDEQRREEASFWRGKWLCLPAENRGVDALQKQLRRKLQETAMRSIDATETQMCAAETPAETQLEDVRTLANKPRKQLMEIRDFLFLSSMGLICYTCGQDQPFYNKDGDSPRNTSRRRWGQESSGYYTCNDCHESPGHRCGWAPMWPAV